MTKDQYLKITSYTRALVSRNPIGLNLLRVPTILCALLYLTCLAVLFVTGDERLFRVILVPAICFIMVTVIRALINRERPYDAFDAEPVGPCHHGKGKSMPSRHTASAIAIALAVLYAYPHPLILVIVLSLSAMIACFRILGGHHYPSDVLMGVLLSTVISCIGYCLIP